MWHLYWWPCLRVSLARAGFSLGRHRHHYSTARSRPLGPLCGDCFDLWPTRIHNIIYVYNPAGCTAAVRPHIIFFLALISPNTQTRSRSLSRRRRRHYLVITEDPSPRWVRRTGLLLHGLLATYNIIYRKPRRGHRRRWTVCAARGRRTRRAVVFLYIILYTRRARRLSVAPHVRV